MKRKEPEAAQHSQSTAKRIRVGQEEAPSINDILPPEVISAILEISSQQAPRVMWMVGRMVCRLWKDLLPSGKTLKKKARRCVFQRKEERFSNHQASRKENCFADRP